MLITVNKKIRSSKSVKYAALSAGTADAVWSDDEREHSLSQKRTNRIRMTRDMSVAAVVVKPLLSDKFDA